jgi:hypothetical protein
MAKLRVHNLAISLDGYAAGADQGPDQPLGAGGTRLHEWVFATSAGRRMIGEAGGDDGVEAALDGAFDAAAGLDVRLGGGPATIQQYLRAGLIDSMHVAIVPTLLGRGERLFDALDGGPKGYDCEFVCSRAVVHALLSKRS